MDGMLWAGLVMIGVPFLVGLTTAIIVWRHRDRHRAAAPGSRASRSAGG